MTKVKIAVRPLDTGKPECHGVWRYALKAELMAAGPANAKMGRYLNATELPATFPTDAFQAEIDHDPGMSMVDTKLFAAILSRLAGSRVGIVGDRIRAQVGFERGAQGLRCLDRSFWMGNERWMLAATKELFDAQLAGSGPRPTTNPSRDTDCWCS